MVNSNQGYPIIGNNLQQQPNNAMPNLFNMNTPYENYMNGIRIMQQQQNMSNQFLKCRPVSSKEEARAFQIDLDGSLWVFTDIGSDKIYTKQINTDGTATFKTYSFIAEDENPYDNTTEYVTKDEFNKVIQTLAAAIQHPQGAVPAQSNKTENALVNFN